MSKAWEIVAQQQTADGLLELRCRDADDFLICVGGRVLMNSRASRSEEELGIQTCRDLPAEARVLIGGLGMAFTLRAVLDVLSPQSRVVVGELHPVIAEWCAGPIAALTDGAAQDPRVSVRIADVADLIREGADAGGSYDAIVLDLFEGPHAATDADRDPLYGRGAIDRCWRALREGGVLGVWAEASEKGFEAGLRSKGFSVESIRPGRGGLKHWVVLARKTSRRSQEENPGKSHKP